MCVTIITIECCVRMLGAISFSMWKMYSLARGHRNLTDCSLSLHFSDDLPSLSCRAFIANAVPHAISSLYSQSIIYAPPNICRSLQNHWHEKSTFCPAALSMLDILLFAQTSANSQRFNDSMHSNTLFFFNIFLRPHHLFSLALIPSSTCHFPFAAPVARTEKQTK